MRQSRRLFWLGASVASAAVLLSVSAGTAGTAPTRLEASPAAAKASADLPPALARDNSPSDASAAMAHQSATEAMAVAHAGQTEAVALAHPAAPSDQALPIAAAHPITAAAIARASLSANAAHIDGGAVRMSTTAHVASLAPSNETPMVARSNDAPATGSTATPDRNGVKPEAILPDGPHADTAKPAKKSAFKATRTAFVVTGPRSKTNSIRNRIWLKHAPN